MSQKLKKENNSSIDKKIRKLRKLSSLILENNKNITTDQKLSTLLSLNNLKTIKTHKKLVLEELSKLLKNFKEFQQFIEYNQIKDITLQHLIETMEYERYIQGIYLFKVGDISNKFFLILKGEITFRKFNNNQNKEIDLYKFKSGNYFGVKTLIYDKKKNKNAFVSEETHCFTVGKENFKKILIKNFIETEIRKKEFLYKTFPIFSKCIPYKIEYIIKNNITVKFYTRNEIIYNEGERTGHLYIIFSGSVKLAKNLSKLNNSILFNKEESTKEIIKKTGNLNYIDFIKEEISQIEESDNKKYYMINYRELTTLINLTSGGIGGLELSAGIDKFKYTMICDCDFSIIYDLDLIHIIDYLNEILKCSLPLFIELEKQIDKTVSQIKKIEKVILPKNLRKNSSSNFHKNKIKEIFDKFNEGSYYNIIDSINKKFDKNIDGFIKLNHKNKILSYEKELVEERNQNNISLSQHLNNYIKSPLFSKKSIKQDVKFIKKENNLTPLFKLYKKINLESYKNKKSICPKISISSTLHSSDNLRNIINNEKIPFNSMKHRKNCSNLSFNVKIKSSDNSREKLYDTSLNFRNKKNKNNLFFPIRKYFSSKAFYKINNKFIKTNNSSKLLFKNQLQNDIYLIPKKKTLKFFNSGSFDIPFTSDLE